MCDALADLREAIAKYAVGFDAALVSAADARGAVGHAAALEAMAATLKALAATRLAGARNGTRGGERSAAHDLARTTGTSLGTAREALDAGRRLADQPSVSDAARRGELSAAQVAVITDAAAADPNAERRLVEKAGEGSLAELRDECARTKAAAEPDPEARRSQIRASRSLRAWTDTEGVWQLRGRANPEDGAQIMAALAPICDEAFHAARREGRREHPDAYALDALLTLARQASSSEPASSNGSGRRRGAPAKILVRVDLEALLGGHATSGQVCEIVGFGPVAVSAVTDMIDSGDPFLAAVATRGEQVLGVAHLGRRPRAAQQSALEWMYPACAAQGCAHQVRLENDHRLDWARSHLTMVDLMDRLCAFHHGLKTNEGWALVEGTGKRAFVAPDDPRHPGPPRATGPPRAA